MPVTPVDVSPQRSDVDTDREARERAERARRPDPKVRGPKKDFQGRPPPKDAAAGWEPTPPKRRPGAKVSLESSSPPRRPSIVPKVNDLVSGMRLLANGQARDAGSRPALDALEAALRDPHATIVSRQQLGGDHINGAFLVTLSNGMKAVWKPTADEDMRQLRDHLEVDHQGRREAAAYVVDKALGHLAGVPPTVFRTMGGETGALMAFVSDASTALDKFLEYDDDYRAIAIFDDVVGNVDRHEGNLLLTPGGRKVPIDHGLSFPLENGAQGYQNFILTYEVPLDEGQKKTLLTFERVKPQVTKKLRALGIADEAIDAMFQRVKDMRAAGHTLADWRE
jgi:hypothetical protein